MNFFKMCVFKNYIYFCLIFGVYHLQNSFMKEVKTKYIYQLNLVVLEKIIIKYNF